MSVAEKRTQVYFPEELYSKIKERAESESKSMAAILREAVERYLQEEEKEKVNWEDDTLFKLEGIMRSGLGDLAANHDHYLYGMKKKRHPKK